jgi:hypothetical protein
VIIAAQGESGGRINKRILILTAAAAVAALAAVVWWRGRPVNRALRMLSRAAEVATVAADDNEIKRRMKALRLRDFTGYELHVDVEGIVRHADLMQDEAVAAWAYVVGLNRYLRVEILDVDVLATDGERLTVSARISVDSNYERGRYSKTYPVVMELISVERRLRVSSLKTRRE